MLLVKLLIRLDLLEVYLSAINNPVLDLCLSFLFEQGYDTVLESQFNEMFIG